MASLSEHAPPLDPLSSTLLRQVYRVVGGDGGVGGRVVEVTGSGTVLNKHERIGERLYADNKRAIKRKQMIGEEISMAEEVRAEK